MAGTVILPVLLGAAYTWFYVQGLLSPAAADAEPGLMAGVLAGFSKPDVLLAAWLHYLAFDFLVGAWIVEDASALGVQHILVAPCLALTFVAGPVGLLAYLLLRSLLRRGGWRLGEIREPALVGGRP